MTVHRIAVLRLYRINNEKRLERILERLRGFYAKNWTTVYNGDEVITMKIDDDLLRSIMLRIEELDGTGKTALA